jgi:hypothetical protein
MLMPYRTLKWWPTVAVVLALQASAIGASVATAAEGTSDKHREAEQARLSDELERLSQRKAWAGVNRVFVKMEAMELIPSLDDYMRGAVAARELGQVLDLRKRLKAAAKAHQSKEIVEWLWKIDNTYGRVELLTVPSRSTTLEAKKMPFDPDQRKAVESAIDSVADDGIFRGMLPEGESTFAGQQFRVEPGIAVRIEVSPRMRRHGPVAPVIVYPDGKPSGDGTGETTKQQDTP